MTTHHENAGQMAPPKPMTEDEAFRVRLQEQHTAAVGRIQDVNEQMATLDAELHRQHRIRRAAETALGSFDDEQPQPDESAQRYITR